MTETPHPRLVLVVWIDAGDLKDGKVWHSDDEVETFANEEIEVISVGFVKSETKRYLTVCADYIVEEDGVTWSRETKIPQGMIVRIDDIQTSNIQTTIR